MEKMTYIVALDTAIACEALPIEVREKLTALRATQIKRTHDNKPTVKQIENEGLKQAIVNHLAINGTAMTISEMIKAVPELNDLSNQRVSAIVRQMVEDKALNREEIKRKAYFSVAV